MKREKRALLLMPEYVWGGAETQFRYLLAYAEKHRWKIDVIIEHRFKKKDALLAKDAEMMKNIRFFELDGGSEIDNLFQKIIVQVFRNMPYVKYNTCLIQYTADLGIASFMRMLGIRVIYSERIDAADIVRSPCYQRCLRFCNQILANSEYGKKELERLTGRKVGLIRNGKPVVPMLPAKEIRKIHRILVPARIAPDKNLMLVLHYLQKFTEFDGKIIFAGNTDHRSYQGKLRQFVRRNNLQDKVVFLGYVEGLIEEYRQADLILLPSFAEGTPNVVLEAFAYGRPVIVSDIGPLRDIVTNPRLRFGIKNPEEIHTCIKYVEAMPKEQYQKMLLENRAYVLENYSIQTMAESFGKVLCIK